jgi:energy-coupling factor transporter ATP-binding protein EcfA2
MFVEKVIENVETLVTAYDLSKKAAPAVQRVFKQLQSGKLKIAIFGAGGTGKTTLGNILAGKASANNVLSQYQESISIEKIKLDGDTPGSVIIVPGQERRQHTWDEVFSEIIAGQITLIINVVSYGYHSFEGIGWQAHQLYQAGMTERQFVAMYIQDRRVREIEALKSMESHIKIAKVKKVLMLTLVTKQDLWWHSREQVRDHYQNGEYNQTIKNIQDKKGSDGFQHEFISTSLAIENFVFGKNELLWPNSEGYDERLKISNTYKLFSVINALCKITLE